MILSIFSSRSALAKSLGTAVAVILLYEVFLHVTAPKATKFQNQWVQNYAAAERYIYREETPRNVIVGSSMSARLIEQRFDHHTFNLSFHGGSPMTGLSIMMKSRRLPKKIYLETNVLEHGTDHALIDNLFLPLVWRVKSSAMSLRYTDQPVNLLLTLFQTYFGKSRATIMNRQADPGMMRKNLAKHLRATGEVDVFHLRNGIREIKQMIAFFENRGVQCAFFEMPVHPSLIASNRYRTLKQLTVEYFPLHEIHWLSEREAANYHTTDGIHLLPGGADLFSVKLNEIINREKQHVGNNADSP